ncbi:MAG: regulatory protein TetR [Subtercola sp.]|nr:regulatory protein TetR [Subtercola sp.]
MTHLDSGRKRRERGSITTEEIVEGAFVVAIRDSIDDLSVPEVARQLDVGVTSIYWHFRKKEDLLRAMSDEAVRAVHQLLPSTNTHLGWRAFLDMYYTSMRSIYRANDVWADLVLVRLSQYSLSSTHVTYEAIERLVAFLVAAGFTPLNAWRLTGTLTTYTQGIIVAERTQRKQNVATIDERQARLLLPQSMPLLSELYENHSISLTMASDDDFSYGLNTLLSAFEGVLRSDRAQKQTD